MKPAKIIALASGLVALAETAVVADYAINDIKTKYTRIAENQSAVLDAVGNTAEYNKIAARIDKNTEGLLKLPIISTLRDDAWEKEADKIKNANAYAEGKEAGVDSMKSVMEKIINEKVKAAIDSFKKAQQAINKKAKNVGKKNTKDAKNTKHNNKNQTNTAKKNIDKAAKKFVKQTTKHIKK